MAGRAVSDPEKWRLQELNAVAPAGLQLVTEPV